MHGYTSNPARALRSEPEAVDEDYQALLSQRAQRDRELLLAVEWAKAHSRCASAIAHFQQVAAPGPGLRSPLRAVSRSLSAVDRRLGL